MAAGSETRRDGPDPLAGLTDEERAVLHGAPAPRGADVMKATLSRDRFSDPDWIFERKLDGIRVLAVRAASGDVALWSRNDLSLTTRFPEVADAVAGAADVALALDGEVVAFRGSATSFAALAARGRDRVAVFFYVFDVLWVDSQDVRGLPLRARKRLLRDAVRFRDPLRLVTHRNEAGEALYEEACRRGWEGVIAKRADSVYATRRSRDWLKFKCEQGQES